MNVKELRSILDKLSAAHDESEVVVSAHDHKYRRVRAILVPAESDGRRGGHLAEYYDDEHMAPGCKRVQVLYIG